MSNQSPHEVIAARVRMARKHAGLSQAQVAKLLGLHRPAVSEIEAGRRRLSADEAARLAEALDVEVAWLLGETQEKAEETDPRIGLAARELGKLKSEDLDRLLTVLQSFRKGQDE